MGILSGLEFRARQRWGSTAEVWSDFWYSVAGQPSSTGQMVNRERAERMITVASCITLIADSIASLPLELIRQRKGGGFDKAEDHALYPILKYQPAANVTSFSWREASVRHLLGSGYCASEMLKDGAGRPKGLSLIVPERIKPKQEPGKGLVFSLDNQDVDPKRILWVPIYTRDGITGCSPITHFARESIGITLSMEEFVGVFFKNGMAPTGVIEMPEKMYLSTLDAAAPTATTKPSESFLSALKAKFGNAGPGARSPFVLQGGMTFKPYEARLVDAQFLELLDAQKLDICGMFHVPPHKVGNHKTSTSYNNTEQENIGYVGHCLMPLIVRFEQAMEAKLLSPQDRNQGLRVKFNVNGLLRGDTAARAGFYDTMLKWGILTADDIRALEDMNPAEDGLGNKRLVPVNMVAAEDLGKLTEKPVKPDQASLPMAVEQRSIEADLRAVQARDRIAARYQPLLVDAMAAVVSREGTFIKAEISKHRKQRAGRSIQEFLDEFYRSLPDWIIQRVGPTMTSFAEAVQEAAAAEIGIDPGMTSEINAELRDYIRDFARQYSDGDRGQLLALLAEPEASLDSLEQRLDEWHEGGPSGTTRAEKVGFDQSTTIPNMIAAATFFSAGYGARWQIRGPSTCPYCRALQGRVVARNQPFLQAGEHQPEGAESPMKVRTTRYPALHAGCDCFIAWGPL